MKNILISNIKQIIALSFLVASSAQATSLNFNTFVSSSDINSAVGQDNTIGFAYAGNKFVGSVYTGSNNDQLYSSDLTGGNVQAFGAPIPNGFSGEVVVAASLGQDHFNQGDIYAGAGSQIYHYGNNGGTPTLFATPDNSTVRQILFDPGSSFAGSMLVTTSAGNIFSIDGTGSSHLVANVGEDTEGMDIASSNYGAYAGQLLVASEGSGYIRAISAGGAVSILHDTNGNNLQVSLAETISVVPQNLGASGNPIEGFYVANYPANIQFAGASQFNGLQGDAIVTSEWGSGSQVLDLHYNNNGTFSLNTIGNLPNQSEDGIFVTAQRITETTSVPEPSTNLMLLVGLSGLLSMTRFGKKA